MSIFMVKPFWAAMNATIEAESPPTPTNPADNDFEGMCIDCTCNPAVELWQRLDREYYFSDAFCSLECAVVYAFDFAERQAQGFTVERIDDADDCIILSVKKPFDVTPDNTAPSVGKDGA